ncbi:MAG: leucyl/phenylalanyl-tRNA--protein transferase [Deltaproteobacteria bacterium]|nr:leucyl/phenylalanyl-tRNA--protein transferase [Deltaproteobacteria bacterium]
MFPPAETASIDGIVTVGARPEPTLLRAAYRSGIFPWPHQNLPLLWFSPDPRFVLPLEKVQLHRSLKKNIRRGRFEIKADTRFADVVERCSEVPRPGQDGTWITSDILDGYLRLFHEGAAHSIEAYEDGELVGGLYGVSFGSAFFGESMFALKPDASKVAFATLLAHLAEWGFTLVDCQVFTEHLARFGAIEVPRSVFLDMLDDALSVPDKVGPWQFHLDVSVVAAHPRFASSASSSST